MSAFFVLGSDDDDFVALDGRFRHTSSLDFISQRHPPYELLASASSIEVVLRMSQKSGFHFLFL